MGRWGNMQMLWAAAAGWMIIAGLGNVRDAWFHEGPGFVQFTDYGPPEEVSEAKVKRYLIGTGVMLLLFGGGAWVYAARHLTRQS